MTAAISEWISDITRTLEYEKNMTKLCNTIKKNQSTLTFQDAQDLQKKYPSIIDEVFEEDGEVVYRIKFEEIEDKTEYTLHSK